MLKVTLLNFKRNIVFASLIYKNQSFLNEILAFLKLGLTKYLIFIEGKRFNLTNYFLLV